MKKTMIYCEFSLFSEKIFSIEKITDTLKLEPTSYYESKKKFLEKNNEFYEIFETCWSFKAGYQESLDINIQLNQILTKLESRVNLIKELKEKYDLESALHIGVQVYNDIYPAIYLDVETIKLLSDLETFIDVDIINYS